MLYTAIIPSKSVEQAEFCRDSLQKHSLSLASCYLIWDGESAPCRHFFLKPVGADVYSMYNHGVEQAMTDWVLLANDDMYFPMGWDRGLVGVGLDTGAFYTVKLVESGWTTVNERNIERDFGRTVEGFDKLSFEKFARDGSTHTIQEGLGWYMPLLVNRRTFMELGGYPTNPPFPHPNDVAFFDRARQHRIKFMQLDSMVYHFQCLSQRPT